MKNLVIEGVWGLGLSFESLVPPPSHFQILDPLMDEVK